jgi:hypothetical protein
MACELWKPIPGLPGYEASKTGEIRSIARLDNLGRRRPGTILKPWPSDAGRLVVHASIGGKHKKALVHRLVLLAHVGPCPDGMECCHDDDNPTNNRLSNLRWGTPKSNTEDRLRNGKTNRGSKASYAKLNEDDVIAIRRDTRSVSTIADTYGVSRGAIIGALYGANWSHVPKSADDVPRGPMRRGESHANSRLTADDVRAIRRDTRPQSAIAATYGITQTNVSQIKRLKTWAHVE